MRGILYTTYTNGWTVRKTWTIRQGEVFRLYDTSGNPQTEWLPFDTFTNRIRGMGLTGGKQPGFGEFD